MSDKPSFLTHVNGMRAIAILGILFYHLNATYCPTGYFGVDVFLVISGYFLLGSLMKAERAGDIHYGSYLLKKSWRIIPSWLLVTCVFCLGSAWFMIPPDRVEICNTAFRSAYFGADFYIDHLYDYFNQKAHQNLFLHFWYLSVICQMYILIPLLVMLLLRLFSKKVAVAVLAGGALISLCFYVLTTTLEVPVEWRRALLSATGMKTAYYHLLPRLWEVLAGGGVLLLPAWHEKRHLRMAIETVAVVGIVASFFCFETGSPKVYTAAICTVAFLRYGGEGWVSRLLSWRPVQWVGTVSFSLYLWHWPIMAAWKYVCLGELTWVDELGMVVLSLLTAWGTWRWVECLKMPRSSSRVMVCLRALPVLLLVLFACGIRPYYRSIRASASDGLRGKGLLTEMVDDINALPKDEDLLQGFTMESLIGKPAYVGSDVRVAPSFLLMGDSHSYHSFTGMHRYCCEHGVRGIMLNNSIVPFWWCYKEGIVGWDQKNAEALMDYMRQHPGIKYVFISLLWQTRLYGTAKDNDGATMDWREMRSLSYEEQVALREQGLREICRRFSEMGRRVVLLADVPTLPPNLSPYQLWLKVNMLRGEDSPEYLTPVAVHRQSAERYTQLLNSMVEEGVAWAVIDSAEPLRRGEAYRTRDDEGQFLYSDNHHITYAGSELVGGYVMNEWMRLSAAHQELPQMIYAGTGVEEEEREENLPQDMESPCDSFPSHQEEWLGEEDYRIDV